MNANFFSTAIVEVQSNWNNTQPKTTDNDKFY